MKEFARYVTLSILGQLGISCYIIADTFFISKGLGANGLTALNLAIPIYNFIFVNNSIHCLPPSLEEGTAHRLL